MTLEYIIILLLYIEVFQFSKIPKNQYLNKFIIK